MCEFEMKEARRLLVRMAESTQAAARMSFDVDADGVVGDDDDDDDACNDTFSMRTGCVSSMTVQ